MTGMPVIAPDSYEALADSYEQQDPKSHLPVSYTPEQVEGYRQQQAVFSRLMRSPNTTFNEMMMMGPGGSIQNLHPASRGTVSLNPQNPEGTPIVDYRAGSNDIDLEVMASIIQFMRRYMQSEEFAQYQPFETTPGPRYNTTEQLIQWAKGQIIPSVYHPIGTCAKVPREWGGCVDEQLRVYGTSRLSVIDGSIMPTNVGATTQMTVYAIAEKVRKCIITM
jgi:choline dehydrogenase-like flavoprotein